MLNINDFCLLLEKNNITKSKNEKKYFSNVLKNVTK